MPKFLLPALIGTGAVGALGAVIADKSREKKRAENRVNQFNAKEVKDWDRFTDNTARKSFIKQLGKDPMADPKLLQYADNMNRLKTGSKVTEIPGDGGRSYQIIKLRGSDRLGCTCNDWRYKRSVAQPGEEQDCKHIKQYRQMSKTAAAAFKDTLPKPVIDGKSHDGTWTIVGSGRLSIPKKTSDIDYMVPLEEVKDLSSFQEYKDVPGVYWRDSETIDGRPSTIVALPRYAYDKIDASYQQATDRFGKRKLRQLKKTLPKDSFYKDIGVVYTSDAMKKEAGLWGQITGRDAVDSAITDREKGLQQRKDRISRLENLEQRIKKRKDSFDPLEDRLYSRRSKGLYDQWENMQFRSDGLGPKAEEAFLRAYNDAYKAQEIKVPIEERVSGRMGRYVNAYLSPYSGNYNSEERAAIQRRAGPVIDEYSKKHTEFADNLDQQTFRDESNFRRAEQSATHRLDNALRDLKEFDAKSHSNIQEATKRLHRRSLGLGAGAALIALPGSYAAYRHLKNKRKDAREAEKSAGHVEDRVAERAPGAEAEVNALRAKLRKLQLRKGQTYHVPLSRGKGYAVIGDVGDKHAVKTVLGPDMRPPGERLKVARAPRDYKREYEQYHAKPEQVENRSLRNQARRKLGLSKGDPREVDHKTPLSKGGGNGHSNLRAVSRTTNRTKFTETT